MGNTFERIKGVMVERFGASHFDRAFEMLCDGVDAVITRVRECERRIDLEREQTWGRLQALETGDKLARGIERAVHTRLEALEGLVVKQAPTRYYEKHSRDFETRLYALEKGVAAALLLNQETPATGPRYQPSPYSDAGIPAIAAATQRVLDACVRCGRAKERHYPARVGSLREGEVLKCHRYGLLTQTFVPREKHDPYDVLKLPLGAFAIMYSSEPQVLDMRQKPQPDYLWGATRDAMIVAEGYGRGHVPGWLLCPRNCQSQAEHDRGC